MNTSRSIKKRICKLCDFFNKERKAVQEESVQETEEVINVITDKDYEVEFYGSVQKDFKIK